MHGGEDQVALVLAVVVVGDDDDLALGEGRRWLRGRSTARHAALVSETVCVEELGVALAQLQDRQAP